MKKEIIGERNGQALQTFNPTSPQSNSQEYLRMQQLDFLQMNDLKTVERDRDLAENSEQMNSIAGMSPNIASVFVRQQAQQQNLAAERFLAELDASQRKNNHNRDTELEFLAKSALSSPNVSDPYQDMKQDLKDSELRGSLCAGIGARGGTGGNLMSSQTKSMEKLKTWNQMTTAGRHSMEEQTISRYLVNNDQTNDSIPRYNQQQDKYNQQQFSNYQSPLIQNYEKQQSFQQYAQGSNIVVHGESNSRDYTNYSNQKMIPEDLNTIKPRQDFKETKDDQPSGIFTNNEHAIPSQNPSSCYYKQGPSTIDIKPQSFKSNVIEEHKIHMQNHNNILQAARNLRNPIQGMQHSQQQLPRPNFDNLYLRNEQDKLNRHHANTLNNSRGVTPISSIQKDDKDLIHIQKLQDGQKAQTRLSFYDSNLAQSQEYTIRPQSKFNYVDSTYTLSRGDFQEVDTISRKQQERTKANTNNESEQIAQVNSFYNKNEIEQNSLNQRMIELKKEITGKNNNNPRQEILKTNLQQQHNQNISSFSKQSGLYEETKDNGNKKDGPSKEISYPIDTSVAQSEPTRSIQMNRSVQIIDINTNEIKSDRIKQHKKYDEPKSNKSGKSAKSTRSASLRATSQLRAEPYSASYFQSLGNLYGNIPKKRSGSMKRVEKRVEFQKDINILGDFDVDRFYMKLMKKERQEFKKILKSQEMVIRFDVEKKLKKQLLEAEEKTKKNQELEKNFIFAKSNNQRLRNEHEKMISKLQSLQNKAKTAQERELEMRETLEEMWQKYEANKQVLIDATRLEVQQEKEQEILELRAQIQDLLSQIEDQNKIYQEKEDLRLQVEILENQKTDLVKENAKSKAQTEKREQENKKLKKEVEQTHAIKIQQLQENYENVIKKFEDLASKSNNINVMTRQYSIDEDTLKNFNNLHSAENSDHPCLNDSIPLGRNPYGLSSHAGTQKTINIHDQVSAYQSAGTIKKQKKDKNEWKLKCQILAEKYFGIIKDIKNQLKKLKKQSADQIEQVRIETTQEIMKKFENQVDVIYLKRENDLLRSKFQQTTPGFQSQEVLSHRHQFNKKHNQDLIVGHQFAQSQRATLGISENEVVTNRILREYSKTRDGEGISQQLGTAKTSSQVSFRSQFGQNYQKFSNLNESHSLTKKQHNSKDASSLKLSDNNFILPLQKLPDTYKLDSKSNDHSSITNRAQREPPAILLRSEYTNSHSPAKNLKNKSASDPDNSNIQNSNNRSSDMSSNLLLRNCNPLFQNKIPKNESEQLLEREAQFQELSKIGDLYSKTQDQRDQSQNKKSSTIDVKSSNSHASLRQPIHYVQNRALSGDATTSDHLQNFNQNLRVKSGNGSNHSLHSGSASLNAYYQKHRYQIYKDQTTLSQQNNNQGIYSGTKMSTLQQILKSPGTSDLSNQIQRQSLNFNSTQQVELGVGGIFSMNKHSTQESKDYSLADMNSRLIAPDNELFQAELPKRQRQNNIPILVSFQRQMTGSLDESQNEPFSFVKEVSRGTPELNGTYNSSVNANFGGNKTSQKSTAKVPTSRKEIQKNIHHQQSSKSFLSKKEGSKLSKRTSDISSQKSKQKSNKSFTSAKQTKPIIRHESTPTNVIPSRSKNRSCSSNNSKIISSADHKVSRQPSPYSFVQSQKRRPSSSRSQKDSHKRQKSIKGINDLKSVISPKKKKRQDLSQDRVSPSAGIDDKTFDYFSRVKQPTMYYNRLVNSELEVKQVKEMDQEEQTFEQLNAEIQKSIEALKDISKYAHASASATSSKMSKMSSSRGPKEVKGKVKGILKSSSSQVNSKQR